LLIQCEMGRSIGSVWYRHHAVCRCLSQYRRLPTCGR